MNKKDINVLGKILTVVLYILRWTSLILAVITAGITIGLITISCLQNTDTVKELVAKMIDMFTYYDKEEVLKLIASLGLKKVVIGGASIGIANTIRLICEYVIFNNFIKLSKSLSRGDVYTNVNVSILNKTIPYTVVGTFAQPIIIYITHQVTTMFSDSDYNVSGIAYILLVLVLKAIIEKGYELKLKEEKNRRELSDAKALQSELQIELIRKESELKELREFKENNENKKTTRKVAKKEEKIEEPVKEETKKKTTTKKKETVKEEIEAKPKRVRTKKTEKEETPKKVKTTKTTEKKTTKKVATSKTKETKTKKATK